MTFDGGLSRAQMLKRLPVADATRMCLQHAPEGLTPHEIADQVGDKQENIRGHLNVLKKTGQAYRKGHRWVGGIHRPAAVWHWNHDHDQTC